MSTTLPAGGTYTGVLSTCVDGVPTTPTATALALYENGVLSGNAVTVAVDAIAAGVSTYSFTVPAAAVAGTSLSVFGTATVNGSPKCIHSPAFQVGATDQDCNIPHAVGVMGAAATAADTAYTLPAGLGLSQNGACDVLELDTGETVKVSAYDDVTGVATLIRGWDGTPAAPILAATTFGAIEVKSPEGIVEASAELC